MSEPTEEPQPVVIEQPPQRRKRKGKAYGSLATQLPGDEAPPADATPALPAPPSDTVVPAMPVWEEGTLRLQQLVQRLELDFLEFCGWAQRAIKERWHVRYGHVDPAPYFEEKVGISYRSVRRRLSILEAVQQLPEPQQEEAKQLLASIGMHKAAAIAPLIGKSEDWRELVSFAKVATEDAVQNAVSERLDHKPRGTAVTGGSNGVGGGQDRFLAYIINQTPPDERKTVEAAFRLGLREFDAAKTPMGVFLVMVAVFLRDLADAGVDVSEAT